MYTHPQHSPPHSPFQHPTAPPAATWAAALLQIIPVLMVAIGSAGYVVSRDRVNSSFFADINLAVEASDRSRSPWVDFLGWHDSYFLAICVLLTPILVFGVINIFGIKAARLTTTIGQPILLATIFIVAMFFYFVSLLFTGIGNTMRNVRDNVSKDPGEEPDYSGALEVSTAVNNYLAEIPNWPFTFLLAGTILLVISTVASPALLNSEDSWLWESRRQYQ